MEKKIKRKSLNQSPSALSQLTHWPWVTFGLMALQIFVFTMETRAANVGLLGFFIDDYDFNWNQFLESPIYEAPRLISHAFFHANAEHITSNLLFFLLFGPSVEKKLGRTVYLVAYLFWGAAAALTQGIFSPFSNGLIGASGAISGAAGAFFVLFPLKPPPQFVGYWFGGWIAKIPAFFWIGLWFLDQMRQGFLFLMPEQLMNQVSLIGYWAHIGGFAAGALVAIPHIFSPKNNNS